jgi:hypothetical protein
MRDANWPCDVLNVTMADGKMAAVPGEVVLDALGRLELRATFPGELHMTDIADNKPVTGITSASRMNVEAPGCWATRVLNHVHVH